MKKIMTLATAAVLATSFSLTTAKADNDDLIIGMAGVIGGMVVGGMLAHHHHHHNNFYQEEYPPGPNPEYDSPPPSRPCDFKSKMQGQVKCGQGQPYHSGYVQAQPMVNPTPCEPFYYQEFVPGYGWQTLRNYRC